MQSLTLYKAIFDWFTVTSFDERFGELWQSHGEHLRGVREVSTGQRRINYRGRSWETDRGVMYVGYGEQRERPHWMVQIGGELADEFLQSVIYCLANYQANVTRADIQITVPEPKGWSQFDLLTRLHNRGKLVKFDESVDRRAGRLETVYIGSRASLSFMRVYVKTTVADERLLRLEIETKRDKAEAIISLLESGRATQSQYMLSQVQRLPDIKLRKIYESPLAGLIPHDTKVQTRSSNAKRREWLMHVCLPAFKKYINAKDSSPVVAEEFLKAIEYGSWHRTEI